jgi:hypothetical protein
MLDRAAAHDDPANLLTQDSGSEQTSGRRRDFQAILARTYTAHHPVGPVAYDSVKVIVVRDGSAVLFSEFGQKPVMVGDVVTLGANTLCGCEPEGHITVTTVYLDTDYAIDQATPVELSTTRVRRTARPSPEQTHVPLRPKPRANAGGQRQLA